MDRPIRRALHAATEVEDAALRFAARHGHLLLRLSIGVVFLWFALPKFKPGLSAVDALAERTISTLTAHLVTGSTATYLLAALEAAIGISLLTGRLLRPALAALMVQMAGTLTPLALFPDEMWKAPFVLTLEGQFIVKNLVLIAAGIVVAGTVRRRRRAVPAAALNEHGHYSLSALDDRLPSASPSRSTRSTHV